MTDESNTKEKTEISEEMRIKLCREQVERAKNALISLQNILYATDEDRYCDCADIVRIICDNIEFAHGRIPE